MTTMHKTLVLASIFFVVVVMAGLLGIQNVEATSGCHLVIDKQVDDNTATVGQTIEYTIRVKNTGNANCTGTGVHILDEVDTRITYVSETHSSNISAGYWGPTYVSADRTLHWNGDTLAPGEEAWIKWKGTVGAIAACSEVIPNTAYVTAFEYNNFHTWVKSNNVNVTATKDCNPPSGECELVIEKLVDDNTATVGQTIEYTIRFKNTGDEDCTGTGVHILDEVDARITYVSETHSSNVTAGYWGPVYVSGDRTLHWNGDTLSPGEEGWVKWKGTVGPITACSETIPNTAYITSFEYNNFHTWVESNNVDVTATKDCNNPPPTCTLVASPNTFAHPGGTTNLTWTTTNATQISIDETINGPMVPISGGTVTAPVTQSMTFHFHATGPGGTVHCNAPVIVTPPANTPMCTLTINKSEINPGESVKVSWTSANVTSGNITPQVGNATPVAAGTSIDVFPSSDTTYTGTFTGPHGTVSCQVQVRIRTPGCQSGCGGMNPPNVVLFQKPGEQPLASIFLSQIPYTGFEAGLALTVIFWLAVALLAALIAYYVVGRGSLRFVFDQIAGFTGVPTEEEIRDTVRNDYPRSVTEDRVAPVAYAAPVVAPLPMHTPVATPASVARPAGIPEIEDVIESRAHAAGVLMSPEAVMLAVGLSKERAEALRMFGDILNQAVKTLPREDGWIMLTSDRFNELSAQKVAAKPVFAITPAPAPLPEVTESVSALSGAEEASAIEFVGAVLSGNRVTAFNIVRSLEHDNVNPVALVTGTATVLDRLYRVRHGGTNGIDRALIEKSDKVSDENLHKLVEIFTHAADAVYSNPFTGLKLALAQAFELIG